MWLITWAIGLIKGKDQSQNTKMTYRRGPEYRPVYRIGSGLAIAGLVLTSCRAEIQPTITETPFSTQPRPTEVLPTAPSYPEGIAPGVVQEEGEIRAAFGVAVEAGGLGDIYPVFNNETLQKSLNGVGLVPILGPEVFGGIEIGTGRIITQVGYQPGGRRTCFPNMPGVLFNPNVAAGQDDWLEANNLIVKYGEKFFNEETEEFEIREVRFQGLGAVSLEQTPQDIICVNAIINTLDNPFDGPLGKVLNVIMDTNGNIYGTLPAIYSADQQVRIDFNNGGVFVGNDKVWEIGDSMAELAAQSTATIEAVPTQTPDILFSLEQRGVIFPADTSSELARENYSFNVRFSEDVLKKAGLSYVQIPEHIRERWFLQTMGLVMYFQRSNFPLRYSGFNEFADEVRRLDERDGSTHALDGSPIFMDEARRILQLGPAPIRFNNADVLGEINRLNLNFVSKTEFEESINVLNQRGIRFTREAEWLHEYNNGEYGMVAFINGTTLEVISFNKYLDNAYLSPQSVQMPEVAFPGQGRVYYYESVNNLIYWTVMFLETVTEAESFDPAMGNTFIKYNSFICGSDPAVNADLYARNCADEANETFSPLYKPTSTATP